MSHWCVNSTLIYFYIICVLYLLVTNYIMIKKVGFETKFDCYKTSHQTLIVMSSEITIHPNLLISLILCKTLPGNPSAASNVVGVKTSYNIYFT